MKIALAQMHMDAPAGAAPAGSSPAANTAAATAAASAATVTTAAAIEAIEANLARSVKLIERAAKAGANLVMFPEVQLSPFFPQYTSATSPFGDASPFAMRLDGPQVQALQAACARWGIWASPNLYIEQDGTRYDTSLLISDAGELVGTQQMVHIAQAPQFYEQDYYAPGDGFRVFDTPLGRIGIVICFDRHYPESIRTSVLRGADLVLVPTANTLAEPSEMFDWEIRVQAFTNSAIVAMCNRCGVEDGMEFSGRSIVAGPDGGTIAQAGPGDELLLADMDLAAARALRNAKPYTQLRRPALYE